MMVFRISCFGDGIVKSRSRMAVLLLGTCSQADACCRGWMWWKIPRTRQHITSLSDPCRAQADRTMDSWSTYCIYGFTKRAVRHSYHWTAWLQQHWWTKHACNFKVLTDREDGDISMVAYRNGLSRPNMFSSRQPNYYGNTVIAYSCTVGTFAVATQNCMWCQYKPWDNLDWRHSPMAVSCRARNIQYVFS